MNLLHNVIGLIDVEVGLLRSALGPVDRRDAALNKTEPRGEERHHAARDVPSAYRLDQHDERIVLGRDPWPKDGPA